MGGADTQVKNPSHHLQQTEATIKGHFVTIVFAWALSLVQFNSTIFPHAPQREGIENEIVIPET